MTISFVAANTNEDHTITIPTHMNGDLIVISAIKKTTEMPSVNAAFTLISATTANSLGVAVGYKFASSNSEVSGYWDANNLLCAVYRGVSSVGNNTTRNGNSTLAQWGGLGVANSGSWVAGTGVGANGFIVDPIMTGGASMVRRTSLSSTERNTTLIDTANVVSSFTSLYSNVNSGKWRTATYELKG